MKIVVDSKTYGRQEVLVDKSDYISMKYPKFYLSKSGNFLYVRTKPSKKFLHRIIMSPKNDQVVDHVNRNTLDNRRRNLRVVTIQENLRNQIRPNNKTGRTGVSLAYQGKYSAQIKHNYRKIHLGIFESLKEAIRARELAEMRYWRQPLKAKRFDKFVY